MKTAEPKSQPNALHGSLLSGMGLYVALGIAWGALLWSTRHGVGLGNDSPAFTGPAQAVASGGAFVSIHNPPLFPTAMTLLVAGLGAPINSALLCLQSLALTLVIVVVWWLLRWATRSELAAFVGAALVGWSYPIVNQAGWADTAVWGAAWSVSTLAFTCRYLAAPTNKAWLGAAMLAAACALLTRYAGFTSVLLVATALWWQTRRPWGSDLLRALAAGFLMCAPCALQMLHNHRVHASATGRTFAWNGIAWDRVRESLATVAQWHLPTIAAGWTSGLFLVAVTAVVLVARRGQADRASDVLRTTALFGGLFVAFHVAVIATVDFWLALDSRVLLPLLPMTVVFGVIVVFRLLEERPAFTRHAVAAVVLAYAGLVVQRTVKLCTSYGILGRGDTAVTCQQSGLANFLRLNAGRLVVTNNPACLFNLSGSAAQGLPITWNFLTNRPAPHAEQELAGLVQLCRTRDVLFVVFETPDNPARMPWTAVGLQRATRRVFRDTFVSVYSTTPRRAEPAAASNRNS